MWITLRIGKNDGKKTARNWLFFFPKCTESYTALADMGNL